MGISNFNRAIALGVVLALAGCAGTGSVAPVGRKGEAATRANPVVETSVPARPRARPEARSEPAYAAGQHRVARGETLYSIAWRYGHDFREVAAWNNISAPFTIYPGQVLTTTGPSLARLNPALEAPDPVPPPPDTAASSAPKALPPTKPATRSNPKPVAKPAAKPAVTKPVARPTKPATQPASKVTGNVSTNGWAWPTDGKVIRGFRSGDRKGVDFGGREGQPIIAAASGDVVYSGSGLRGYGQLIIIKHNKNFLSAYAHNKKLHVKEGDKVVRGQRIADMGRTGAERVKLHFEIRKNGKPVDPFGYLPRNPGRR